MPYPGASPSYFLRRLLFPPTLLQSIAHRRHLRPPSTFSTRIEEYLLRFPLNAIGRTRDQRVFLVPFYPTTKQFPARYPGLDDVFAHHLAEP
jgi:hypothetical protein